MLSRQLSCVHRYTGLSNGSSVHSTSKMPGGSGSASSVTKNESNCPASIARTQMCHVSMHGIGTVNVTVPESAPCAMATISVPLIIESVTSQPPSNTPSSEATSSICCSSQSLGPVSSPVSTPMHVASQSIIAASTHG